MTFPGPIEKSPTWGRNFKLVVGLTFVGIVAWFLLRFSTILPPLLLTFILTYLLRPFVDRLSSAAKISWRASVNIIFLIFIILVLASLTLSGVAVVQQFQSLISVIQRFVTDLPEIVLDLSSKIFVIGPFKINFSQFLSSIDLESFTQELLGVVQPVLGQAGSLLGTVASRTIVFLGWGFFILLVSYFILADMGQVPDRLVQIELPGYDSDLRKIGRELSRIWNAFLRGQIIMFTISVIVYIIIFAVLGVRYILALALVSGLARFIPYIGQWVNWLILVLVVVFQKGNYFGLSTLQYVVLVVAIVFIVDQIFDNIVSPRIMGRTIGVHPAALLIAAIIGFSLLGIVGVIIAAPGLASLTMLGQYVFRKMLDLDPWPDQEDNDEVFENLWRKWWERLRSLKERVQKWLRQKSTNRP